MRNCKRQNNPDCSRLNNRTETIIVINSEKLLKPLGNQSSFVVINGPIGFTFGLIDPFTVNQITASLRWNQSPCLVVNECLIFILHSRLPMRGGHGFLQGIRFTRLGQISITHNTIRVNLQFLDATLETCARASNRRRWGSRRRRGSRCRIQC
jgi:hypothetical protein